MSFLRLPSPSGWKGIAAVPNGPCELNRPKPVCPGSDFGSTARGKSSTFSGMPVSGWLPPATDAYAAPRFAPNESFPTTGLMSWFASPVVNDRTTVSLSASLASFGNVPPNVTPGMEVFSSPVAERISAGAVIFGSNVSIWLGPPWRKRKITDLSVSGLPLSESLVPP